MVSVRHYKRRKRLCFVTISWCSAMVIALLACASVWFAGGKGPARTFMAPAMDTGEPDLPQAPPPSLPVNGDGMVDTPGVVLRLLPALLAETTDAVHRGDAAEMLRQLNRWIASGEALHSGAFRVFLSVLGAGVLGLCCWSFLSHILVSRDQLLVAKASGIHEPGASDNARDRRGP